MNDQIQSLSFDAVIDRLLTTSKPYHTGYLAMYSSWYGGIVTDPALMMIPVDDHLVHRGDGIFEAFKCVAGKIYLLARHLDRLERSAGIAQLTLPATREELVGIVQATMRAAGVSDAVLRIYVSRGPGGFSANPYECPSSQLYVLISELKQPAPERYQQGTIVKTSAVPMKRSYFANLKSCNYLPNVLMEKEAVDEGVDFTISLDEQAFLGEGAIANIAIVTEDRVLLTPRFDRILQGTTVTRALELARTLVDSGELDRVEQTDIALDQAYTAAEVMMCGTTLDTMPVVRYDDHVIGTGKPGPICRRLRDLMIEDQQSGKGVVTPLVG